MKQADFDKKVDALTEKVGSIDSSLETESGEIKANFTALRDEISRLQASQGDNIDTSRLDEISSRLESSAARISGLVDPMTAETQTPPIAEPSQTVDATATATATPAASVETETTVTTKTEESAGETAEATATADTETATAEASVASDSSDNQDEA